MPPHIDPFGGSLRFSASDPLTSNHQCLPAHGELVGSSRAAAGHVLGSTHGYLVGA